MQGEKGVISGAGESCRENTRLNHTGPALFILSPLLARRAVLACLAWS